VGLVGLVGLAQQLQAVLALAVAVAVVLLLVTMAGMAVQGDFPLAEAVVVDHQKLALEVVMVALAAQVM
jgi:hypothetical protein